MSNDIEKLVAPIRELSALAVSNIEKLTELQLKGITQCADANVQALKSANAIKDVKDLQAYIDAQTAAAVAIAENAEKNAKTIAELGQSYAEEAKKIAEDAFSKS